MAETATTFAGATAALTIAEGPLAAMTGTVNISGTTKFGQTLTANISLTYTPPTTLNVLTYQWKRGGTPISGATASTYTLVQADIGTTITVTVTADGTHATGSVTSLPTAAITKADGPAAPAAPALASKTGTSITLVANALNEFSRNAGVTWQSSEVFTGLTPLTVYTFIARVKETATTNASAASTGTVITLDLAVIDILAIAGVTPPVAGATPVTKATATVEYEAPGVVWSPAVPATFAASTVYTATIYITPTAGYTLTGVAANSFTVAGAAATNAADSGVVTAVFPATCSYFLSKSSDAYLEAGGKSSVTVTASAAGELTPTTATGGSCAWNAASNVSWIQITYITPTSGSPPSPITAPVTGSGTVAYTVSANTPSSPDNLTPTTRSGNITIGGTNLSIVQTPPSSGTTCSYVIAPYNVTHTSGSGTGSVAVTADAGCSWKVKSNASWITVTAVTAVTATGSPGVLTPEKEFGGSGTVAYSVEENTGNSSRFGTVSIAGWTFNITQDGTGGSTAGTVTPSAPDPAQYAVIANATLIATDTVQGAPAGLSPTDVLSFTATDITTPTAQVCFSFSPALPASSVIYKVVNGTWYQISPVNELSSLGLTGVSFDGAKLCFTIEDNSAADGCAQLGIIQDPITFGTAAAATTTIPGSGGGGGGGVNGCTFALGSTLQKFSFPGGTGSIQVTASTSQCIWSSYSRTPWIKITSITSATEGSGEIVYTVTENTSLVQRTGSIAVGSHEFQVIQEGIAAQTSTTTSAAGELTPTTTTTSTGPGTTTTTIGGATTTTTTASTGCSIKSIQPTGIRIGFGLIPRIRRVTVTMNTDLESLGITCADLTIQNAPKGARIISCAVVAVDTIQATILFWGIEPGTYNINIGSCGSKPFVVSRF